MYIWPLTNDLYNYTISIQSLFSLARFTALIYQSCKKCAHDTEDTSLLSKKTIEKFYE